MQRNVTLRDLALGVLSLDLDAYAKDLEDVKNGNPKPGLDLLGFGATDNEIDFIISITKAAKVFKYAIQEADKRYEEGLVESAPAALEGEMYPMIKTTKETPLGDKYKINEIWRSVAEALCDKYPELGHIDVDEIIFLDNIKGKGKSRGRLIYAQTGLVSERWQEVIYQMTGQAFSFFIEFFKENTQHLSREQMIVLLYHELRHIDEEGQLVAHHIEEWVEVLEGVGHGWSFAGKTIPDLLDVDVDWESLIGSRTRKLFGDQDVKRDFKVVGGGRD
jgi:predicted metallopeptidase